MRRVFDTVNPTAVGAGIDIELSQELSGVGGIATFTLEQADGTVVTTVSELAGTAGRFFPNSLRLYKLLMPKVPPGDYVIRAKGYIQEPSGPISEVEATMSIQLQQFRLDYAGLRWNPGLIVGGTSRIFSMRSASAVDGTLYVYGTGATRGICESRTPTELASIPGVMTYPVTASPDHVSERFLSGDMFADADTACFQFVRSVDGVAEKPFSLNLRYLALPASGDALLALDSGSAAEKSGLALVSMPEVPNSGGYDFLERRQVFARGDVAQQPTSNSGRITLEQTGDGWQYRLGSPTTADHPAYVAYVEGKAPLAFYLKP
ncbi:hypothetical protein [Xenophilus sp.]|uniref:hypothetical protein n=1 Tax=Xenophilus sp. TaxID=1873499 RepID=UPI0037DC6B47